MTNPTATDITAAILQAMNSIPPGPQNPVVVPAAHDAATLTYTSLIGGRVVKFNAAIPVALPVQPMQKVFAPGWGTAYFGNAKTAQLNANMGPFGGLTLKRYPWSTLEAAEGVYTLGAIGQAGTPLDDLEQTRLWNVANPTRKRHLLIMVEDKNFFGSIPSALPVYLRTEKWSDPVYSSGQPAVGYEMPIVSNMGAGTCSLRWVPRVVNRFNALTAHLASQLDGVAEFAGIATLETATGFDPATQTKYGYSAQAYANSYITILTAASKAFVQSKVFWFFNFLTGGEDLLLSIAQAIATLPNKNVLAGGPDLLPETASLTQPGFAYSFYPQMAALGIKMFIQLSPPGYKVMHSAPPLGRYWSFKELHDYAVSHLHVSYILAVPTSGHILYSDLLNLIPTLPLT